MEKNLKKIALEIDSLLIKHDIAGIILLHDQTANEDKVNGTGEYIMNLSPSYSVAINDGEKVRVKVRKEDFQTGEEMDRKVAATLNMFTILKDLSKKTYYNMERISETLNNELKAEHGKGEWKYGK